MAQDHITISHGGSIGTLPEPQRAYFTFKGWYTAQIGGSKATEDMKITGNCTLYARWERSALPFTDVGQTDWYYDSIRILFDAGIVKGMTETTYEPNATTTRGQMAVLLHRVSGLPAPSGSGMPFRDVAPDAYYREAVLWGYHGGILKGTSDTTYAPEMSITREQFATMLYRLRGEPAVSGQLTGFSDSAMVSGYAGNAMLWATQNGIVNGMGDGTLAPTAFATRAQVAAMLLRYMNLS